MLMKKSCCLLEVLVCIHMFFLVSRLFCESESFKMDLILDINSQIYPVNLGNVLDTCYMVSLISSQSTRTIFVEVVALSY